MIRRLLAPAPLGVLLAVACLVGTAACGSPSAKAKLPAAGAAEADKYLFDHGNEALAKKHWSFAREYYKKLVDTYPQSQYRQDAKLGIGDTYIGENSVESDILAANEFREFLNYFPLNPRADYAQFKIGVAHFKQMLSADRDQTPTEEAIVEFDRFLKNYPTSPLRPEAEKYRRQARDRLSSHDYLVGLSYYHLRWYPGALARFKSVLADDPTFSGRDGVYFYLAETLHKSKVDAEALPYYDRIGKEFQKSEYLKRASQRIAEIKH